MCVGKGTRASNQGQLTPIFGADKCTQCTPIPSAGAPNKPPSTEDNGEKLENVQLQKRRLAPNLGSVPLKRHRIFGGSGYKEEDRVYARGYINAD